MGSIYTRGDSPWLWFKWRDAKGTLHQKPSKFRKGDDGQRAEAERALEIIEREVAAQKRLGAQPSWTVALYSERWLEDRRKRGLWSVDEDQSRLRIHVLPVIGPLSLADVTRDDVLALVGGLRKEGQLSPKSILNIYGVLRTVFEDARLDKVLPANHPTPCTLKRRRGELPRKVDKDPKWRATAVYTRAEVEAFISDERIPEHWRVFFALVFVGGGQRFGEAAVRTWADWDRTAEPLGSLSVHSSWNTKHETEKDTKTGKQRLVPVHPLLARILAEWRLYGWAATYGRFPTDKDFIVPRKERKLRVPNPEGARPFNSHQGWKALVDACAKLGFRRRRVHDLRRTLISLLQADGADRNIVKLITHGPGGDVVADYTTLPWTTMCQEMGKLKVGLREGRVLPLAAAAGYGELRPAASMQNDKGAAATMAGSNPSGSKFSADSSRAVSKVSGAGDADSSAQRSRAATVGSALAERGAADYEPRAAVLGLREIRRGRR